jgi:hypothetical protein
MKQQTTVKDLESKIKELNRWTKRDFLNGNADLYILGGAYGGYRLEKQVKQGGIVDVLKIGYVPKKELYSHLFTLIQGIIIGIRQEVSSIDKNCLIVEEVENA